MLRELASIFDIHDTVSEHCSARCHSIILLGFFAILSYLCTFHSRISALFYDNNI